MDILANGIWSVSPGAFKDVAASAAESVSRTLAAHWAAMPVLQTDCCGLSCVCEAAISLRETTIWRLLRVTIEALRNEPINHYQSRGLLLNRGCAPT
jgi:hypothetical protein